ncbi:MAG: ATP-binding protein [Phototrophicaceae bacterium]
MTLAQSTKKLYISVRFKLLFPFILIIFFVSLFALPIVRNVTISRLEQDADNRLNQSAIAFGLLLERAQDEAELVASFVANLPSVEAIGADASSAGDVIMPLKDEFDLQELSYYPPDYRSGVPALYDGRSEIDRQNVLSQRALAIRDAIILASITDKIPNSGVIIAPQSSQIIAVAPVLLDEQLTGIIIAVFFIDESYINEISSILDVDAAIINDNDIVATTSGTNLDIATLLQTQLDLTQETQVFNVTYADGSPHRLSANPLIINGENQGTVIIIQSSDDVNAVQGQIQRMILILLGVIVGVMLLYAIGVIVNFALPLKRLVDATARVSEGQLNERIKIPQIALEDEVVDLSRNFNAMTEQLSGFYIELEQTVLDRTEALVATLQELEIKRDEALDANKTKSLFLANMSHELRTPLNAIIGYSEMLEEEAEDFGYDDIVPDLRRIQSAGNHLLVLINDILDISKIEAGAIELYLEDFDLEDLIDEIAISIQPIIQKNGNRIKLDLKELGQVHSDSTRVRQILTNLLSNATKFTENGIITIKADRFIDDTGIERFSLAVIDTGIGMTSDEQDKVFDEFIQADTSTTRKYGGTGLGLPISRHFAKMLGGTISVSSVEGEGSTFTVILPVRVILPKRATTEMKSV